MGRKVGDEKNYRGTARMKLSYSTMRLLHECPHNYLNKTAGIKQPESEALTEGKEAHRLLQLHVSGKQPHELLSHIKIKFPIVEEVDFDERTRFEVPFGNHIIFGFVDGLDKLIPEGPEHLLEGKFSSSPWGLSKYLKDPQRKIYGWAIKSLKDSYLVTGQRVPEKWASEKVKTVKVEFTPQDYIDAEDYINKALEIIRSGDFTTDLVDGKCRDPRCWWGERCMFK
jgi:hypothetical protein